MRQRQDMEHLQSELASSNSYDQDMVAQKKIEDLEQELRESSVDLRAKRAEIEYLTAAVDQHRRQVQTQARMRVRMRTGAFPRLTRVLIHTHT